MIFIVYSQVSEEKLSSSLGMPEYSYYFVLKGYLPVLQELGQVIPVKHPEQEVDAIYDECCKRGEDCVFLTFSPPNKSAVGLRCPTVCVFAWEFDRIPDEVWDDDPKNDWRYVFADHGRAITLSQYSADAVRKAMGRNFPVVSIPVPVWDAFEAYRSRYGKCAPAANTDITIKGNIVDSNHYLITSDSFTLKVPVELFQFEDWQGEKLQLGFTQADEFSSYLGGFYLPEPWGTWSSIKEPWLLLPCRLSGGVHLKIAACGYANNFDRDIFVALGDEKKQFRLKDFSEDIHVSFWLNHPESILRFSGLDLSVVPNSDDARSMGIGLRSVEVSRFQCEDWIGETLQLGFTETDECGACMEGFYKPEPWGTWSCTEEPGISLPYRLNGTVHLKIEACGYANNFNRDIFVELGDEKKKIRLKDFREIINVRFQLSKPAYFLKFSGLDLSPVPNVSDPRSMGIGLRAIEVSGRPSGETFMNKDEIRGSCSQVSLEGVIYSSVFNPGDDRKNWMDMIKAFCWAFNDVADATLVLKMTHHSVTSFLGRLHYLLQQMWPFQCRIVVLHGYLEDSEYEKLIAATHFYVNTSRCEGLCLPLMEFMSCGKPAIAPCNTSLTDYVDSSTTLIVQSDIEPSIWPHDPRQLFRTLKYRIDWMTLVNAYKQSYDIVKNQPAVYETMAESASSKMKAYSSNRLVREQLHEFLQKTGKVT